jgi:hypothetical protein
LERLLFSKTPGTIQTPKSGLRYSVLMNVILIYFDILEDKASSIFNIDNLRAIMDISDKYPNLYQDASSKTPAISAADVNPKELDLSDFDEILTKMGNIIDGPQALVLAQYLKELNKEFYLKTAMKGTDGLATSAHLSADNLETHFGFFETTFMELLIGRGIFVYTDGEDCNFITKKLFPDLKSDKLCQESSKDFRLNTVEGASNFVLMYFNNDPEHEIGTRLTK